MLRLLKLAFLVLVGLIGCIILIGVVGGPPANTSTDTKDKVKVADPPATTKSQVKQVAKDFIRRDWPHLPSNTFTHRHSIVKSPMTKNTWNVTLWVSDQQEPKWVMYLAENKKWEVISLYVDGKQKYVDQEVEVVDK